MLSDTLSLAILGILGLAIGFVGGLVGLVLGVIRFPLILGTEVSASITAGTNIGISTLGALTAAIRHYRQHNIHLRIFVIMASTGAVGGFLGARVTKFVPVDLLFLIIGIIVSYEAYVLISGSRKRNEYKIQNTKRNSTFIESCIGFGIGFLGGVVGLVLGSIRMPAMISVLKMEPKVAVGTNLAAATIMGISALIGHLINNEVDYLTLGVMGSTAMIGGYIGAKYTGIFRPERLKLIIGFVLIIVAIFMFANILLSYRSGSSF